VSETEPKSSPAAAASQAAHSEEESSSNSEEDQTPTPQPQPDRRPIKFLKAKLLSVDCSPAPAAILTVVTGAKTIKLRTKNYKLLVLVGADEFY
jgi:hypothetical protein